MSSPTADQDTGGLVVGMGIPGVHTYKSSNNKQMQ